MHLVSKFHVGSSLAKCSVELLAARQGMGSMGWARCYWCEYWVENPYIIDWIGEPLCDWCFDWHLDYGGGPYEPSAVNRLAALVRRNWPQLPKEACALISECLVEWHVP